MRHWLQLGIRNWRVRPGRTAGGLAAIALGVGVVIWVTCAYESVRLALQDQVWLWTGRSHLSVESSSGPEGTIEEKILSSVAKLPNVQRVTPQLRYNVLAQRNNPEDPPIKGQSPEWAYPVAAVGIDPANEPYFRPSDPSRMSGRMVAPGDDKVAVIEYGLSSDVGVKLGDTIYLIEKTPDLLNPGKHQFVGLKIIGLLEHRRVAKQQLPVVLAPLSVVQKLAGYDTPPLKISKIDVMLKDPSLRALQTAERQLRAVVQPYGYGVTSAEAKLNQVKAAERQTSFVLLLISTVALFTAFFVILSTLSMGMIERIGQLGTLRCLGTTRGQLAAIVMAEAIPLGLAGILLGIPVGIGLAKLSVWLVPQYIGQFALSSSGVAIALAGGSVTTLIGTLLPMIQAMRVSPLAASRPQAKAPRALLDWISGLVGVGMILGHSWMIHGTSPTRWLNIPRWKDPFNGPVFSVTTVILLYCGYALTMPLLVRLIGQLAVYVAAAALRVRHSLLSDQVGRASWRSAAICCGLMVGLSLIVTLVVYSRSLAAGWDFPKNFCEAFVHMAPPVPYADADQARRLPGLGGSAIVNVSTQCSVYGKSLFSFPWSRFISGDPDEFFNIAKLEFLLDPDKPNATSAAESDRLKKDAIAKLKKGGYVFVTPEFTRAQKVGVGDKIRVVPVNDPGRGRNFEIAAVVTSPALDIAANYFNAGGMLASQSAYVVLGTQNDLRTIFHLPNTISMFLLNFDIPETQAPAEFKLDEPPLEITQPAVLDKMVQSWSSALPERSAEIDTIRKQIAMASTPSTSRPETTLSSKMGDRETAAIGNRPSTGSGPRAESRGKSEIGTSTNSQSETRNPQLKYSDLPMLNLFRAALAERLYPEWRNLTPSDRWRIFREELILRLVPRRAKAADEQHASVRALKIQIDRDLSRATMIFTAIPMVALIVAALGVGNLMMANVTSRTRQIAMLRAVGATKWQVTRLIVGEAIVLGALGSALGVALGLHAATGMTHMTEAIWGIRPVWTIPWGWVTAGISFTVGVCLIAGIIPARHASRNNIIDALQTT